MPKSEIVVATNAPYATRLAAKELNFFLKGIFGCELPLVGMRTEGRSAIALGASFDGEGAVATQLPRDGFVIETKDLVVRIFGNDDDVPGGDIAKTCWYGDEAPWQPHFRRGTLFGVYEFLERYAGVRMYFPGEHGTIQRRSYPDVFFVWDIFVARGVFAALQKLGVRIPEEVSVVVQTNFGLGLRAPCPVTRFEADGESVGATVAGFVLSILQKGRVPRVPTIGRTYVIGGTFPR